MKDRTKVTIGATALVVGAGLVLWNLLRDPNRGYYEQPKHEEVVTIDQIPHPVRAVIQRASAGGVVTEIQRETKDGKVKYDADIVMGTQKIGLKIAEDGSILERKAKKLKPRAPQPVQS
jgi:hypothetical protein